MPESIHQFRWCEWTKWLNLNKEFPDYITACELPFGLDKDYFRHVALLRAKEFGAHTAHVQFFTSAEDIKYHCIRLQFCWKQKYHQGIHVDGVRVRSYLDFQRYAPWPPLSDEERKWGMTHRIR